MKNKNLYQYGLAAGYAVFSYATTGPYAVSDAFSWTIKLFLCFLFSFLIVLILFTPGKIKPLASLFCLVYIMYLLAWQVYIMCLYMKTYHGDTSMVSIVILTAVTVMILNASEKQKIAKIALPMFAMTLLLVSVVLFVNCKLFNPMNLYGKRTITDITFSDITMFDFILPLYISISDNKEINRKKAGTFTIMLFLTLILLSIFIFGCLKGDYMYSLSPLQIIFRISRGNMIKSYDAVYNVLLCFAYFSAVALITDAYKSIKQNFKYFSSADLLLSLGFLFIAGQVSPMINLGLIIAVTVILLLGREKVANEKS